LLEIKWKHAVVTDLGIELLEKSSFCCWNGIVKPLLKQPKLLREKHAETININLIQ